MLVIYLVSDLPC